MTDREWLASDDPHRMLEELRGRVSGRKLRLFACACDRVRAAHEKQPGDEELIAQDEDRADGLSPNPNNLWRIVAESGDPGLRDAVEHIAQEEGYLGTRMRLGGATRLPRGWSVGCCHNMRCMFGNPFPAARPRARRWLAGLASGVVKVISGSPGRPDPSSPARGPLPAAVADPSWLTPTVTALARGMYDTRDFSPMPILADALEDAGCADARVLGHCRDGGPHARGCWVVDALLGKS